MELKRIATASGMLLAAVALVVAEPQSAEQAMSRAAKALIASLEPEKVDKLRFAFASEERFNWHFVPRERKGLSLKDMTERQRTTAFALLRTGLSEKGFTKAETIRSFENILRAMENGRIVRDPELYFFSIFGEPGDATWGWRYEGHHIAQNWTIAGGKPIASSPAFLGANPAEVRDGPQKGTRPLGAEEDLARALIKALTPEQLREAIVSPAAPNDILTLNSRKAARVPHGGIVASTLTRAQQGLLMSLIEEHAMVQAPALAASRLQRVKTDTLANVRFAWLGTTDPGGRHYYSIQGASFLIEYDNTQNNANHQHIAWRDFAGDFGEDVLAAHYASDPAHQASVAKGPDWAQVEPETLRHFQALLRFDTSDPPGREADAAKYLVDLLRAEGLSVETFALEPHRPNVVARLKGNGKKRPLLLMGHTDVVNVDPKKWTFPPFSATRDGGYVYGRGAVDDKDNLTASLMVMLLLKRLNVPLDRDVIFLAESGEEGSTRVGIQFMVNQHYGAVDAEYCLAEGGNVTRTGGQVRFASVQTLEKVPYNVQLVARGPAGHGSVPLKTNAVARLSAAVAKVADWRTPIRLNETTSAYFKRLAEISPADQAARYRAVLDPARASSADEYFLEHEPRHASMLRTSVSPNIFQAGYRINVIPSEATATLDVRALPGEQMSAFLDEIRKVVNDPSVEVSLGARDTRPSGNDVRIDSEAFKTIEAMVTRHYKAVTLPTMSTGATDMAYLRGKGMQCYGVGPATDTEDGPKGFGAHSDQERILESELYRFVRFYWDAVVQLAASPASPAR